jgi:hypothetical protein
MAEIIHFQVLGETLDDRPKKDVSSYTVVEAD